LSSRPWQLRGCHVPRFKPAPRPGGPLPSPLLAPAGVYPKARLPPPNYRMKLTAISVSDVHVPPCGDWEGLPT